ncbi:MAG TPA: VOC family protein [candidate division Zixibacteria bacterium]|nr:VOC family protein [candidate division Zixibacteria bacterium]
MIRLRRLTIVARDPVSLSEFYRRAFDLQSAPGDGAAVCLSDGEFSLELVAQTPGVSPGLRSLGFSGIDRASLESRLVSAGVVPVAEQIGDDRLFSDPDGNLLVGRAGSFPVSPSRGPAPIRHAALYTPDPRRLADFYCRVLEMREVDGTDRGSIFVSDGYLNLALLFRRTEEKLGLNHFGFHVRSNGELRARVEKAGADRGAKRPDRIPFAEYRIHDPEGNGIDISEKGWKA